MHPTTINRRISESDSRFDCDALDFTIGVVDELENLVHELVFGRIVEVEPRLPRFGVQVVQRHEPAVHRGSTSVLVCVPLPARGAGPLLTSSRAGGVGD